MQDALPVNPPKKISRDEMNLAEFPLAMLSTRGNPKIKTLEFRDVVKGKNGELLNRDWIITGADKFGLPTASDDEVLLGLLKLTVDDGMVNRKVFFTRYELLRILRWTTEGRSYTRLQRALDRLSGVRIKASNAFYDNQSKLYNTKNFGIVDAYEINDAREPDAKSSFFIWSEVLFGSFQAGFIKKLDLDFYLDLQSAVSKRLYRYLDKHFWYKSKVQVNLFTLAHEKIGISRNYRFASSLRQQLDPAVEELTKLGFLSKVEYVGRGSATEVALFAGKATVSNAPVNAKAASDQNDSLGMLFGDSSSVNASSASAPATNRSDISQLVQKITGERSTASVVAGGTPFTDLVRELVVRGIKPDQAQKVMSQVPDMGHEKVKRIIEHYDSLRASSSPKISRSPQGFLFHAVKNWETFMLPFQNEKRPVQGSLGFREELPRVEKRVEPDRAALHRQSLESDYLVARRLEIKHIRDTQIEKELLVSLTQEVEKALSRIRDNISPQRFAEAVEHGVDDKIASLFAVPSFDEWVKDHPSMRGRGMKKMAMN